MAHLVPSQLSASATLFWKSLIQKYDLNPVFCTGKKRLRPGVAESWSYNAKRGTQSQYLDHADKAYAAKLDPPFRENTIGWYRNDPMFIFLKRQIGPLIRANVLTELTNAPFTSCKNSARPELQNAVAYNKHKNPEAKEWNPGFKVKHRYGIFTVAKHGDLQNYPHMRQLVELMSDVWREVYPKRWGMANQISPAPLRLVTRAPFNRLAVLKSAASAIHVDAQNGLGVGVMTTLEDPNDPYQGGVFCFVEYGITIAVKPGDILIADTPGNWHCNVGPITGTKYSIVAYSTKMLGTSQVMNDKYRKAKGLDYKTKAERDKLFDDRRKGKLNPRNPA